MRKTNNNHILYESIMRDVSRTVRRHLNENSKSSVIKNIKDYIKNCDDIDLLQSFVDRTLTQDEINRFTSYCYYDNDQAYYQKLVTDQFLYDNFDDLVNMQLNKISNILNNRTSNYDAGAKLLVDWFLKYAKKSEDICQTIDDWRYDRDVLTGSSKACQTQLKRIIRQLENNLSIADIDDILKNIEHLGDGCKYDNRAIQRVRNFFNV